MSLGAIDWGIKVFCKELIVFLGYRSPCLCWGSMYDVCYVCMFVVCASFSCPCTRLLTCLCVYELVLLFAASPVSNLPKFSTLKHSIFVQNGPSPFSSHISFLKQGPTYRAIPEKHGLLRWASGKEPTCRCRRLKKCGFSPWVRKIPWRRAWQITPVFLSRESHGQRSLESYGPWGRQESEMTEAP